MITQFVLIEAEPKEEYNIYNSLTKMDNVEQVHPLFGEWDIIIKITSESLDDINIIIKEIQRTKGVKMIKTLAGL
jgi:DNA-binding Lrp family transcriptional regulator